MRFQSIALLVLLATISPFCSASGDTKPLTWNQDNLTEVFLSEDRDATLALLKTLNTLPNHEKHEILRRGTSSFGPFVGMLTTFLAKAGEQTPERGIGIEFQVTTVP